METDVQQGNQKNQVFYVERPLSAGNVSVLVFPLGYFSADVLLSKFLQARNTGVIFTDGGRGLVLTILE